ncbi:MAG: dihydroorotase, partial [Ulvibacter sp.]
ANLTLFDPNVEWTFKEDDILSTSKNAAFLKSRLKGKAYGIYANKKLLIQ